MSRSYLRRTTVAALSVVVATTLAACGGSASNSGNSGSSKANIVVGVYAPLTGPRAPSGEALVNGVELAATRINDAGGINGRKLEIVKKDDQGEASTSTSVALELATRTKAVATIGTYGSDLGLPSSAALERQKMPNIQPFISAPSAGGRGFKYTFLTYPNSVNLEESTFQKAISSGVIAPKKLALVYVDGPFAVAAAEYTKQQAKAQGYEIVADEKIQSAQASYSSVLTKVKAASPDAIWSALFPAETKTILTEMSQLKLKPKVLYTEGNQFLDPTVVKAVGGLTEGTLTSSTWWANSPVEDNQQFVAAYKAKYSIEPALGAAGGYQAVEVLEAALKSLKSGDISKETVRQALASLAAADTVMGSVAFDDKGQLQYKSLFLIQTQAAKEVLFLPESRATAGAKVRSYLG
jgi:branched-chain amino acid transport system substrate-binding protein